MRNITIHSDGFGAENSVIVDEEGNKLERVRSATIYLQSGEPTEANLDVAHVKVVVTAVAREVHFECPICSDAYAHRCDVQDEEMKEFQLGQIVAIDPKTNAVSVIPSHWRVRIND